MRTKSLLIAAAALAAGIASSSAQVYSQNVVGYINLTLSEGFNMITAPLDADGTGVNNTISSIFSTNLPVNSTVYIWNGTGFTISSFGAVKGSSGGAWDAFGSTALNPGIGCFLQIPIGAFGGGSNTGTVTLTGTVLQGSVVNHSMPGTGIYGIIGSAVPVSGGMQTTLGYTPAIGDTLYFFTQGQPFGIYSFGAVKGGSGGAWSPSEPQLGIGQGFWFFSAAGSGWTNNFTVQ